MAPLLSQTSDRHRSERAKLSTEISKPHKSKEERREIRDKLKQLGDRQKQLLDLFYRHKDISGILKIKLLQLKKLSTNANWDSTGELKTNENQARPPGNSAVVPPQQCDQATVLEDLLEKSVSVNELDKYVPIVPQKDVLFDDTQTTTSSIVFISDFLNENFDKSIPNKRKVETPVDDCSGTKFRYITEKKNTEPMTTSRLPEKSLETLKNLSHPISIEREIEKNIKTARVQGKELEHLNPKIITGPQYSSQNSQSTTAIHATILSSGDISNGEQRPLSNSQGSNVSVLGVGGTNPTLKPSQVNSKSVSEPSLVVIPQVTKSGPNIHHRGANMVNQEMQFSNPYQDCVTENRRNYTVGTNFSQNLCLPSSPNRRRFTCSSSVVVSPCTSGSDVFSVKCKELDRRLHERFGSQTQLEHDVVTTEAMAQSRTVVMNQTTASSTTSPQTSFKTPVI